MTTIPRQDQRANAQQRLVFPSPTEHNRGAAFRRALRGLNPTVRGVALPVGSNQSVQCPQRGEIPGEMCADCPLLIKLKSRGGNDQGDVLCAARGILGGTQPV